MNELEGFKTAERALMARAAQRRVPANGSMELLPLCNMNCDMCYVRLTRAEMEAQGRMHSGEEWLALGRQMAEAGVLFLLLTGGEPLLHPEFKEVYLGLKKMGFILTLNTNATLLDEEWADFFAANKPRRINITLYGADADTYDRLCHHRQGYDRVVNAVKLLRERKVDVRLGASMTKANISQLDRIHEISQELDVPLNVDTYMLPAVRERTMPFNEQSRLSPEEAASAWNRAKVLELGEDYHSLARAAVDRIDQFSPGEEEPCASVCMAGKCSFAVNWQGLLRPCVITTEPAANVFEQGFVRAWRHVSEEFDKVRFCSVCSVCTLRPVCQVCPVSCKEETASYMGKPEYLCRYAAESERLLRRSLEESAHE